MWSERPQRRSGSARRRERAGFYPAIVLNGGTPASQMRVAFGGKRRAGFARTRNPASFRVIGQGIPSKDRHLGALQKKERKWGSGDKVPRLRGTKSPGSGLKPCLPKGAHCSLAHSQNSSRPAAPRLPSRGPNPTMLRSLPPKSQSNCSSARLRPAWRGRATVRTRVVPSSL